MNKSKIIRKKNSAQFNCRKCRTIITPFLNGKTDYVQNAQLLKHIDECANCQDELKTTYMVLEGLKRLERGQGFNLSDDFGVLMKKARSVNDNIRISRTAVISTAGLVSVITFVMLILGILGL